MNKNELIRKIEQFAPPELAEGWDCSGWAIETDKQEINKVMLCLTVTDDVVKQAKQQHCDMIISHHPLFQIDFNSELMSETQKPLIDVYSAHTNLDRTIGGTTDRLIELLGLTDYVISNPTDNVEYTEKPFTRYIDYKTTVEIFVSKLRKISPNLRYVNNNNIKFLNKIAFCAGSGTDFIEEASKNGADALVTGDLKFHTALESPIALFDIGHFESEIPVLDVFESVLNGVDIVRADEKSPFLY